jgi:hypothetical protein
MKMAKVFVISIVVLLFAVAAWSQCPWPGEYSTTDGTLLGGRSSEAWCSGVGPGQIGNTENAMSWDPVSGLLGTQWMAWGMSIAEDPLLIYDGVDGNGNGVRVWQTTYEGGQFWLAGGGYFGPGSDPFDGQIYNFEVTATQTFSGGSMVGLTSNISFEGTFNGCDNCILEYVITNAMLVWYTGMGPPMPDDYPDFLCGAVAGELFDVCCIDLLIRCGVGVEETTWGAIKSLYK